MMPDFMSAGSRAHGGASPFVDVVGADARVQPPSASALPTGFDAVVQCDARVLQRVLVANLQQVGARILSVRVPWARESFPPEVRAAVGTLVRPNETALAEVDIELRLIDPHLVSIGAGPEPQVDGTIVISSGVLARDGGAFSSPTRSTTVRSGSPAQIAWTLELNLLRRTPIRVASPNVPSGGNGGNGGSGSHLGGDAGSGATVSVGTLTAGVSTTVASGQVVTQIPASVMTRPELLQTWIELDVARTQAHITTLAASLTALLGTSLGTGMMQTAMAALTTQVGVRLSPLFALGGSMSPPQIAGLGLAGMQVARVVHNLAQGRQLLSLGINFGNDGQGSLAQLHPFIGASHFGYYVSLTTLAPVLRERWRMQPASREYVGNIRLEMPVHEGADETGQGTARVRVRLHEALTAVTLTPFIGEYGDVFQLSCDQEVQLLQLWWPDGTEVSDLGELGAPATMPFVVNNALFTPAEADEATTSPLRRLLRYVLEPIAFPFIERFDIQGVTGFSSAALGAVSACWSLHVPRPQDSLVGHGLVNSGVGRE
jgi:hypothetical protein